MAEILGILSRPDHTVEAIEKLQGAGYRDLEIYSPVPSHEIEHALDRGPSRVRAWTLIGGLTGVVSGYLLTIWTALDWPIAIGAKAFESVPAYTIIAFELTILFGGLATVAGLIAHGMIMGAKSDPVYRPAFSEDQFGFLVRCHTDQITRVQDLLQEAGCQEVRVVEG